MRIYKKGLTLWIIPCLFAACRLGNNISMPPTPDPYSGYYTTLPLSLSFTASTPSSSVSKTADIGLIPTEISAVMTNPVQLSVTDITSGKASLIADSGTKNSLLTHIYSGNTLALDATNTPQTFWKDSSCQTYFQIIEQGQLVTKPPIPTIPGNTKTLLGQLEMAFQVTHFLQGNCAADLTTISQCYTDATQCNGDSPAENDQLHTNAQSLFQTYITAGAMTAADIAQLTSYGYTAIYQ